MLLLLFRRLAANVLTLPSSRVLLSAIVSRAWSLSAAHWKRYVFPRPDLPPDGKVAKDLLKSVPMLEESQFDQPSAIDEFGIVLNVKKLQPNS